MDGHYDNDISTFMTYIIYSTLAPFGSIVNNPDLPACLPAAALLPALLPNYLCSKHHIIFQLHNPLLKYSPLLDGNL